MTLLRRPNGNAATGFQGPFAAGFTAWRKTTSVAGGLAMAARLLGTVVMHTHETVSGNLAQEFHYAIQSSIDAVDSTTEQIMGAVRGLPCATGNLRHVQLALAEALANAIIHGNHLDPNKGVHICVGYGRSGDLVLVITDQGEGFDHNLIENPTVTENLLSSHGRGLFIIKHLMDSIEFRLGGRQLIMRKRGALAL
jgi:anti-sigma regulatory factor (Ser/Thr protein kinase)